MTITPAVRLDFKFWIQVAEVFNGHASSSPTQFFTRVSLRPTHRTSALAASLPANTSGHHSPNLPGKPPRCTSRTGTCGLRTATNRSPHSADRPATPSGTRSCSPSGGPASCGRPTGPASPSLSTSTTRASAACSPRARARPTTRPTRSFSEPSSGYLPRRDSASMRRASLLRTTFWPTDSAVEHTMLTTSERPWTSGAPKRSSSPGAYLAPTSTAYARSSAYTLPNSRHLAPCHPRWQTNVRAAGPNVAYACVTY